MVPTLTGMEGRRGNGSRRLNEDDEDDGPSRGSIEGRGQGRLLCERGGQLCEEEEEGGERAAKKGEESRRGGLEEKKGKRKKDVQGGVIYPTRTAPGSVLGREFWARCYAQRERKTSKQRYPSGYDDDGVHWTSAFVVVSELRKLLVLDESM